MKIYYDETLSTFNFWGGAVDTIKYLTLDELDTLDFELENMYPEGVDETEINDLFWFENDFIAQILGYDSFENIIEERS